ncbi:dipeptidase [Photobacterium lipolyticum]|uniref:Peptidase M19 n=1 Tax=Photobacterium lipolyticum TaxID=266810 RepID=A0A2T3MZS0_9GAMM|nr:membrane dipeptidase [Photobacterium lipolyticum]PSW05449.1 peptidase M19 [Photobacterium lipolyticum]
MNRLLLRIGFLSLITLVVITLFVLRFIVLKDVDSKNNAVLNVEPYSVSAEIRNFHQQVFVADLHADSLLWGRDIRIRNRFGHIDIPRLIEGGLDLQVFGVVTQVPKVRNYNSTNNESDTLPLLFISSWRSPVTWFSPKQRALAQAAELEALAKQSELTLVLKQQDLTADGVKGLLSLEGMHALQGGSDALKEFYLAGYRMMGLTHFFDNQIAGSAHGVNKGGLTELGRALIPQMESLGITIDLAHASPAAFRETLELATKPIVVSHGGVQGTCPGNRNLTDEQIGAVAKNADVIGIGYWKSAVCDPSVKGVVKAIFYTIKVAGIDHVGLGSDFDGNVTTPFDTTGVPMLTEALLAQGLSREDVSKVLGGNVFRVLKSNLPE